ncbi:hypothetical protein BZG36_04026 [Bifiguratus adelaidae]|uniref:Uncharacterized protein n=1 Tax=Bifiguratus adelaidae TaxID=1938954 RepID=A0A261XYN9_9FUNG|nr:hypothetical protein BZG36_04026 [Bifiguratus adelaidae]
MFGRWPSKPNTRSDKSPRSGTCLASSPTSPFLDIKLFRRRSSSTSTSSSTSQSWTTSSPRKSSKSVRFADGHTIYVTYSRHEYKRGQHVEQQYRSGDNVIVIDSKPEGYQEMEDIDGFWIL